MKSDLRKHMLPTILDKYLVFMVYSIECNTIGQDVFYSLGGGRGGGGGRNQF